MKIYCEDCPHTQEDFATFISHACLHYGDKTLKFREQNYTTHILLGINLEVNIQLLCVLFRCIYNSMILNSKWLSLQPHIKLYEPTDFEFYLLTLWYSWHIGITNNIKRSLWFFWSVIYVHSLLSLHHFCHWLTYTCAHSSGTSANGTNCLIWTNKYVKWGCRFEECEGKCGLGRFAYDRRYLVLSFNKSLDILASLVFIASFIFALELLLKCCLLFS